MRDREGLSYVYPAVFWFSVLFRRINDFNAVYSGDVISPSFDYYQALAAFLVVGNLYQEGKAFYLAMFFSIYGMQKMSTDLDLPEASYRGVVLVGIVSELLAVVLAALRPKALSVNIATVNTEEVEVKSFMDELFLGQNFLDNYSGLVVTVMFCIAWYAGQQVRQGEFMQAEGLDLLEQILTWLVAIGAQFALTSAVNHSRNLAVVAGTYSQPRIFSAEAPELLFSFECTNQLIWLSALAVGCITGSVPAFAGGMLMALYAGVFNAGIGVMAVKMVKRIFPSNQPAP